MTNTERDELKIAMFAHFKDYHGNHKNFKTLYGFGGRSFVWILKHISSSITWSLFTLKTSNLVK